ncbi:MAG TPA: alpha/beta hydrolase domain-containing protein, partial [Longimicrobiales bacterium]|nr:alpha/beta hydrolase domain-containing protein [Longimicrobiales bacterium]
MISRTLIAALMLVAVPVHAEVVRIEVTSRADVLAGKAFGAAGPYEKLAGRIYFAVDPRNSVNQIIADISLAPKNAAGQVEFSSDFYLIKPKEPSRGNGTLLYEVSNRGGKGMIGFFNYAAGSVDPQTDAQFGDGFLLEHGFTLMWIGWQFDPPKRDGLVRVYAPIAREADGRAITGLVRSDFVLNEPAQQASLADRNHLAYPVSNPNDPATVLTVRDSVEGARHTIPRDQWQFTEDGTGVRMAAGFQPKRIYEVVYRAQDPPVVGVGPAAVRDAVSKLKYGGAAELGLPKGAIVRAVAFGISQSGRFLRTYLYYGFNEDESHRKVFDGVMAHVAGGGRGSFNHRFAQPSRDGHPYLNFFYPTDIFPFTDGEQRDPVTGVTDGLLTHATKPAFQPNIFYTNSSYEYWGRAASLYHTTIDGTLDARLPPNVRGYLLAAGQHGVAAFPPSRTIGQQLNNPLDYRWVMRALLLSMNRWVTDASAPPPSALPRIDQGTLVTPDKLKFPRVPAVNVPTTPHKAYRADYGPDFISKGIVAKEPPEITSAYPILVPQVDADGNELAGIRVPELMVPIATYTGWNLFNDRSGPPEVVSSMQGSFIPFARTRADRARTSDPRPSVEERYRGRAQYLERISETAHDLVAKGYLLKSDVPRIVEQAGTRWDYVA